MSIDNFIWVPAGIRDDKSIDYRKYKSCPDMLRAEQPASTAHQVFLAHGGNSLVDDQYFFESADDARWFWFEGYQHSLCVDNYTMSMPYDRMALWIDNKQVESRGYSQLDRFDTETDDLPTGESRCDHRYKAEDHHGDVEWARCTNRATLRAMVTPAKTVMAVDGSAKVTYTPLPAQAYEAKLCVACHERSRRNLASAWSSRV
jgi:hypothetical protein